MKISDREMAEQNSKRLSTIMSSLSEMIEGFVLSKGDDGVTNLEVNDFIKDQLSKMSAEDVELLSVFCISAVIQAGPDAVFGTKEEEETKPECGSSCDSIEQFVKERNEALSSLDEDKIRAFYRKWNDGAEFKTTGTAFWGGIHKAITSAKGIDIEIRRKSKQWLKDHDMKSMDDGDL